MVEIIGALAAGFFGGLIGTISGGGGLITIPYLLFAGLPIDVSIATSRMSAFGMGAGSLKNFHASSKIVWSMVPYLIVLAVIGGIVGAFLVISLDKDLLEKIAGAVLLLLLPTLFVKKDFGLVELKKHKRSKLLGAFIYLAAMMYGAFFGPGAGIFLIYSLVYFFGLTFIRANATNLVAWMALTTVAFVLFSINGLVDFKFGISMLLGVTLGGYFGSNMAIRRGDGFVKAILTIVVLATSAKLLVF
ncbi:MAG TPA: sulfite exporter TauE/SafE family protein [Candidatus Saccharimonadales bacterium]|nr:sulfite exporter TauE/SafE family protein [Candidatus Saccharimonadales bacterium]